MWLWRSRIYDIFTDIIKPSLIINFKGVDLAGRFAVCIKHITVYLIFNIFMFFTLIVTLSFIKYADSHNASAFTAWHSKNIYRLGRQQARQIFFHRYHPGHIWCVTYNAQRYVWTFCCIMFGQSLCISYEGEGTGWHWRSFTGRHNTQPKAILSVRLTNMNIVNAWIKGKVVVSKQNRNGISVKFHTDSPITTLNKTHHFDELIIW